MRLWVHLIWLDTNPQTTLQIAGPREDRKLEDLISGWGDEYVVATAWYLYVNSEPRAYNLEPVNHVNKYSSKDGTKTYVSQVEDQSAVTRFPLSAFLATSEGYVVQASLMVEGFTTAHKEGRRQEWVSANRAQSEVLMKVHAVMKKRVGSLKSSWGAANEIRPESEPNC